MKKCRNNWRGALFLLLALLPGPVMGETKDGDRIGQWTGRHTRLVWVQDQGDGADTLGLGKNFKLYGYDSEDGRGERPLLPNVDNFFMPLITPDGKQVIVSNRLLREMYLVEWEGSEVRKLGSGVAVAIWQEPRPSLLLRKKTTWVYCLDGPQPEDKYGTAQPLYRFPLDDPGKKELIWDKTNLAWSNIQLSRDGEVLGGLFPWPDAGVLWTKNERWQRFGNGCWTSLSPDNSKLLWVFDGLHRNIKIHSVTGRDSWDVRINSAPGIGGYEVYHPRWSNHPRYFVITGPYEKGDGGNRIGSGGEKVEIHIGRFDEQARSVEDWFKVTDNGRADFFPDLWIEGGNVAKLTDSVAQGRRPAKVAGWPSSRERLVFVWENMKAGNQLDEKSPVGFWQCNIDLRGRALHDKDFRLATGGGWGETGEIGKRVGAALARTGRATVEFSLIPETNQHGRIVSLTAGDKPGAIILQQGENLLVHTTDGVPVLWPGILVAGQPLHLVLTSTGDRLELFVNGKSLGEKAGRIDFSGMKIDSLSFGDPDGGWHGTLSGIAIYNQTLEPDKIAANSRIVEGRNRESASPERIIVEGKLAETTEIPALDAIGAYRRALVVNTYSIDKIVNGEYGQDRILVAEWAILDRAVIKKYETPAQPEQLVLEKFTDHPELEGERQMMDVFEPDLELYYRIPQATE